MNQVAGPQGNWMRLLLDLLLHELQVTTSHQKSRCVTCLPFLGLSSHWNTQKSSTLDQKHTVYLKTQDIDTILTHWFPRHFHKNPPNFKKKTANHQKPLQQTFPLWTPRVSKFNESRLMCELEVKLNASKTLMSSTRKNGETGETRENPKKKWTSVSCVFFSDLDFYVWSFHFIKLRSWHLCVSPERRSLTERCWKKCAT